MNRLILSLYNILFPPLLLILLPGYLLRILKRGGYRHKAAQRFGIIDRETAARIGTGRIWIHAVSVGEVGIALKFADEYRKSHPSSRFLISSTTSTGLSILERSASDWLEPVSSPVDFPILMDLLMKRLAPSALFFVEGDLWPNRIHAAKKLGIPVALINARLSPRSERRFLMVRPLAAPWFNQLDLITLSDAEDLDRFRNLGVNQGLLHRTGNMKHDLRVGTSPPSSSVSRELILLAASTHQGEEDVVAQAWRELLFSFPTLSLVIAPRHAERRREIASTLRRLEIPCSLRSEGGNLSDIPLLLDTTGELASWYRRAAVVFVGKSLSSSANHGGQNMIEALQAGAPVLTGPHTANFEPLATRLAEAGAMVRVDGVEEIVCATGALIGDPQCAASMIDASSHILSQHQGSTVRNVVLVERLLAGN